MNTVNIYEVIAADRRFCIDSYFVDEQGMFLASSKSHYQIS